MEKEVRRFITEEEATGQRLDQWLAAQELLDLSRSRIQALIKEGQVFIDEFPVSSAKQKLRSGQEISIYLPEPVESLICAQEIPLDILYEDQDLLVLNKPSNLVVHPGNGNYDGTLVNGLLYHCGESLSGIGGVKRPGIVHRLDKNTSGVMVVAKNDYAHQNLAEQFADHGRTGALERHYFALIWGGPPTKKGKIETALGRAKNDRTKRAVVSATRSDAKHAITHYEVLEEYSEEQDAPPLVSLIRCRLETGRTHQIRVHMSHIKHPLIGDAEYGQMAKTKCNKLVKEVAKSIEALQRQALHAISLRFIHPRTQQILSFSSDLPEDMSLILQKLRENYFIRKKLW